MSPHSSPRLSSGRIKDRTRETAEIEPINFCDFQKVPDKSFITFSLLLSTSSSSNEIINNYFLVYNMAGSQLEVVSAAEKILVFTSRITTRGKSKSMSNALRDAGFWDMYRETADSTNALRLDVRHTLP